ncbi:144_t:CDS:2, partial [Entrophospora sp. SA101]
MSSGNNYGLLNSDDNDNDNDVTYHYESSSDDTDDTSNKMKKRKYRYEYFVVAYAENDTIDGVSEILFLNYILAGTNKHDGIQQYVEFLKHYLSPGVLNLCHNLDRICRKSYLECRQLIKKWNKDNDNPTDDENLVIEAYDECNQCSVYAMDLKYDASIEALTVVKYIVIKSANIILNNLRNPTNGISI